MKEFEKSKNNFLTILKLWKDIAGQNYVSLEPVLKSVSKADKDKLIMPVWYARYKPRKKIRNASGAIQEHKRIWPPYFLNCYRGINPVDNVTVGCFQVKSVGVSICMAERTDNFKYYTIFSLTIFKETQITQSPCSRSLNYLTRHQ